MYSSRVQVPGRYLRPLLGARWRFEMTLFLDTILLREALFRHREGDARRPQIEHPTMAQLESIFGSHRQKDRSRAERLRLRMPM